MTGAPSELLTVSEVAALTGLTAYQVRAEHDRGVLPGRRPGRLLRFTRADIDTYIERIAEDRGAAQSGLTDGSRRRSRRPA